MRTGTLALRLAPLALVLAALALAVPAARDSAAPLAAQATDRLTAEVTPAGCGTISAQQTSVTSTPIGTPTEASEWTFPRGAYVRVVATANAGCSFARFELVLGGSVLWTVSRTPFQFQLFSGLTTTVRAHFTGTPTSTPTPTPTPTATPAPGTCTQATLGIDPATNTDLAADCAALLAAQATLAGTATLNWSANSAITSWTGVTVSGTPQRVTRLNLASQGLTGELSGLLGSLTGLTQLRLDGNTLTGRIPSRLEQLTHLTHVFFGGNRLSGCVPLVLRTVANNDVATLGLSDCPAPTDISYGEHTLAAGTYKFVLVEGGAPVVFDVPAGLRLEIVGMVQSDSAGDGPFIGLILREVGGRSWICVDVERSEECGRRVLAGAAAGASGASGNVGGANAGSRFDRIAESLWTDDSP